MKRIQIVEWENKDADVTKKILRLPFLDIADIVAGIEARKPLAVIPPYSESPQFTARCATMVKDRLSVLPEGVQTLVLIAAPNKTRMDTMEFIRTLSDQGFGCFAMRGITAKVPLNHLFNTVGEHLWFHIAGLAAPPREGKFVGNWSYSEEGL